MTTLQESAMRLALAALTSTDALPYEDWMRASGHPAIKALNAALAQQELPQKERPDFMAGYDAGMADAKRMAQQGEPTDDQLVKGVKAMRLFVTKNSVADFKLGYMAALAAAPAPQAQHSAPRIRAMFECIGSRVVGSTEAPIKRVEHEDDDSFTVVIDHWPDMGPATAAPAPQAQQGGGCLRRLRNTCWRCAHEYLQIRKVAVACQQW